VKAPTTDFPGLKLELLDLFDRGVGHSLSDRDFNDLALRIFRFQCMAVPAYGAFVRRRGVSPAEVRRWELVPFLPTAAFKNTPLMAGEPNEAEAVFQTSGTTGGRALRGRHFVRSLELYRGSLLPNFRANLLPDGRELQLIALLPKPEEVPESSLGFMVGEALDRLCGGRGDFYGDPELGLRPGDLRDALRRAEAETSPVLLVGTAFAFVHWLGIVGEEGWRFRLPVGSRVMETGGFKGRSRALPREELYCALEDAFGIPRSRMVNEYGMTELLSQFYEPVMAGWKAEGWDPTILESRFHRSPPWVRTLALDPLTLEPVAEGEVGILAHFDLANLGSVSAILTEDLGCLVPGGIQLQGRSPGAEPRGCSLAMEDFLAGVQGGQDAV